MVKSGIVACAVLVLLIQSAVAALACVPTHAYVDCAAAKDGTGTVASPYNSLADVNRLSLSMGNGDTILFKRGTTCKGTLSTNGSGDPSQPLEIGAYGSPTAARPAIDANGGAAAVQLANQQDVHVSDLDLSGGQAGVSVTVSDFGPMRDIVLQDLDIHNVTDGITVRAAGTTLPSALDGVRILANRIHAISGNAVSVTSNWCRRPDVAPDWHPSCPGAWDPIRGLQVSGNLLYDVTGNGIAVSTTQGASVVNNWLEGFGGTGVAVSDSTGATVAANQVSGGRAAASGPGPAGPAYEVGLATDQTTLHGNLSHDNAGGFMVFQSSPQAPVGPVSALGNISVDDHGSGFEFTGGPVTSGRIAGNTVFIGNGIGQEITDSKTDSPLNVQFAGNIVTAMPGAGPVGWNLPNTGWVSSDNVLHNVPVPAGSHGAIPADPGLAAPSGDDPFGYRLLAGSPALGSGVPIPGADAFPLSLSSVPVNAPNIGAVQAAAGPPVVLSDTFDPDPEGAAPAGWTVTGPGLVKADPASFTGHSLSLSGPATAERSFAATGGDARIDLRTWAAQAGQPLRVQVLDTQGRPVVTVGLADTGHLTYSDAGVARSAAFTYPVKAWTSLSLLLHPTTGTYSLTADGLPVATGKLTGGSGIPGRISVATPNAAPGASFAVDDVMVSPACCPCA
jgi:nitrous oxidase accessory protein NosD